MEIKGAINAYCVVFIVQIVNYRMCFTFSVTLCIKSNTKKTNLASKQSFCLQSHFVASYGTTISSTWSLKIYHKLICRYYYSTFFVECVPSVDVVVHRLRRRENPK